MKTTLVVMAAGMGSRYGGDKQTDGIGPHRETLMEYAVYDAVRAGFRKAVFIVKPGMRETMEILIGDRLRRYRTPEGDQVEVAYVYQDFSSIPSFYHIPEGRTRPFGTGHALLCAADAVQEPFCVINADDYYGADAYRVMREALVSLPERGRAAMVGYVLENTVSRGGTVSRGICQVEQGMLRGIQERLKIGYAPDGGLWDEDTGEKLSPDAVTSMNLWGFAPSIFPVFQRAFETFLRTKAGDNPKAECQLPTVVGAEMAAGELEVEVLHSQDAWFGMTYREDRENVARKLAELHQTGRYPDSLWGV